MKITELGSEGLTEILERSLQIEHSRVGYVIPQEQHPQVVGSLMYGTNTWDQTIPPTVAGRMGSGHVPLHLSDLSRMSLVDLLAEFEVLSSTVDVVLASYVDTETFGGGPRLISALAERSPVPFLGLRDEIYAHTSALAHLSLIHEKLGSLVDKRIAICWTYGTDFALPSTVHSVLLLGALLGAQVQVISPPEFQPLRRIVRQASDLSNQSVELETPDKLVQIKADAIIALNWSSLEALTNPDRLRNLAFGYRDWYLSKSSFAEDSLFLTEPPISTEVSISPDMVESPTNLTSGWLSRQVAVTISLLTTLLNDSQNTSLY
ncbi:MAG: hypothetical protein K9W43_10110 [Candidatus Thorarchaeota archaeon]|nr:hypothetical protein [Candidatus Thorarchaeota archaeon]